MGNALASAGLDLISAYGNYSAGRAKSEYEAGVARTQYLQGQLRQAIDDTDRQIQAVRDIANARVSQAAFGVGGIDSLQAIRGRQHFNYERDSQKSKRIKAILDSQLAVGYAGAKRTSDSAFYGLLNDLGGIKNPFPKDKPPETEPLPPIEIEPFTPPSWEIELHGPRPSIPNPIYNPNGNPYNRPPVALPQRRRV